MNFYGSILPVGSYAAGWWKVALKQNDNQKKVNFEDELQFNAAWMLFGGYWVHCVIVKR